MNVTKLEYNMEKYDEENISLMLSRFGLDVNNYFIAMTKPSMLNEALLGSIIELANRYCIVSFSETEINLIMLSRVSNKKVTEVIKIPRSEIINIKFSNILISYTLSIKTNDSTLYFQVFKKVGKFTKIKSGIESFKKIYVV